MESLEEDEEHLSGTSERESFDQGLSHDTIMERTVRHSPVSVRYSKTVVSTASRRCSPPRPALLSHSGVPCSGISIYFNK